MTDFVAASVATLIIQNNKLLLGKRFTNNQFEGWQCPGGFLHKGETVETAARRHCLQKAGLEIDNLLLGSYSNNIFSDDQHTVTLYLLAKKFQVKDNNMFTDEQLQWRWFNMDNLPEPMFLPLKILFEHMPCSSLLK